MKHELRYTLLSDGSSDRALLPILTWLLREHLSDTVVEPDWADLRRLPRPPKGLTDSIQKAIEYYPCDLLFIHRDAENQTPNQRRQEIHQAVAGLPLDLEMPHKICVIPVRMQEAWLLFDEIAVRSASGNPHGQIPLDLPSLDQLESLPNPKDRLHQILCEASELPGRRLKKFRARLTQHVYRIVEYIDDFSELRKLEAFRALEHDIKQLIHEWGCLSP